MSFWDNVFGPYKKDTTFGSAQFLGYWKTSSVLNRYNKGFALAYNKRLSEQDSCMHCLIQAPSGMGKTSRVLLLNTLDVHHSESLVITDPAGELLEHSQKYLEQKGYNIKVLDITDSSSQKFNCLERVKNHSQARKLAKVLIDAAGDMAKTDQFWTQSAYHIVGLCISALKNGQPKEKQNPEGLYTLLNLFGHAQKKVDEIMVNGLEPLQMNEYMAFCGQADKVKASILSTAKTALSIYSDPEVRKITSEDTINFEAIRKHKTALFLCIPEHQVKHYKSFIATFYDQVFSFCMNMPSKKDLSVYFLLEEFANTGVGGKDISTLLSTIRKRRCGLMIVLQDFFQLSIYGKDQAQVIFNNCAAKIILPGIGHGTARMISDMLGYKSISYRPSGLKMEAADHMTGRPLLTADEVRTIKDNEALLIFKNLRPIKIKTTPWYKQRKLRRRANF